MLKKLFKRKKAKLFEFYKETAHHDVDGFRLYSYHYRMVREARKKHNDEIREKISELSDEEVREFKRLESQLLPLREDFKEAYDTREGYDITGAPLSTGYHPWHDRVLVEKETGTKYIIELVCKHHDYGYYWVIIARKEGTKSHATIWWENISCRYNVVLEGIAEARERYEMI
jgi:hypothetical protein